MSATSAVLAGIVARHSQGVELGTILGSSTTKVCIVSAVLILDLSFLSVFLVCVCVRACLCYCVHV